MARTVNVRVMIPNASKGVDPDFLGHYDLQIEGTVEFENRTFTDPVFSYRSDGTVDVFDGNKSSLVYNTHTGNRYRCCDVKKWTFQIEAAPYYEFLEALESTIASVRTVDASTSNTMECTLVEGNPFKHYAKEYYNCFAAVSLWVKAMWVNRLRTIFNTAHSADIQEYKPAVMVAYAREHQVSGWSQVQQ